MDASRSSPPATLSKTLSGATRYGIHASKTTKRGFLVTVESGIASLSPETIEHLIDSISAQDVTGLVRDLAKGLAPESLSRLEPDAMLKLRAIFLLGLGDARFMNDYERGRVLGRTFSKIRVRTDSSGREHRELAVPTVNALPSRSEREHLIRLISQEVENRITASSVEPNGGNESFDLADSQSTDDAYVIEEYVDQVTYPGSAEELVVFARRRRIRAIRDDVSQFRQHYSLFTNSGAVPQPYVLGAGRLSVKNVVAASIGDRLGYEYDVVVEFPAISRGETRTVEWVTTWAPSPVDLGPNNVGSATVTPSLHIEHVRMEVSFAGIMVPQKIWHVDNVLPTEARRRDAGNDPLPSSDFAEYETEAPREGRTSGIIWQW